jgi:L-ascorbate metabolism protein UlaG (beta-lactamase superfamily)
MPAWQRIPAVLLGVLGVAALPAQSSGVTLQAKFLGVATVLLDDGEIAVMTDGFFSRPGLPDTLLRAIAPDQRRIDEALKKAGVTQLAAVMTAHSHYDHAMDAPLVAARTGAVIVGSQSTANIARGLDFPAARIRVIKGGETFAFGKFKVTAIKSPHSPDVLFPGEITEPLRPPARVRDYKEGGNYSFLIEHAGRRILVHASANFARGSMRGMAADVVFLGIGALGKQSERFTRDYWREIVQETGARLVIPIHWDNLFRPLDEPLEPLPFAMDNFEGAMKRIRTLAAAGKVTVSLPRAFEAIDLSK